MLINLKKTFKIISILPFVLLATFFINPDVALANGGFTKECKNIKAFVFIRQGGYSPLNADCNNAAGQLALTYIDLNRLITNNDGKLVWQENGNFAASVKDCRVDVSDVSILQCKAAKREGGFVDASINLDEEIGNYDGELAATEVAATEFQVTEKIGLIYDQTDVELAKTAEKAKNGKAIKSVKEAADAAKDLAQDGKLNTLILVGHGASGSIGLGSGTESNYIQGKELRYDKLDDVSGDLDSLKESLAKESYVILSSCETGKGANGLNLVKQLSNKLSGSLIFANTQCVGLTADKDYKKGSVCSVEGKKTWQKSTTIAAQNNEEVDVTRSVLKKLADRLCTPKK